LRKPSRVIGEVTRLAVDSDFRSPELLNSLFRATYQYARAIFGLTDVVIEVNPRMTTTFSATSTPWTKGTTPSPKKTGSRPTPAWEAPSP
jgi:hypothetical protein